MTTDAIIGIATIIALSLAANNKTAFAIDLAKSNTSGPNATAQISGSTMLKMTSPNTPVVIRLLKGLYDSREVMFITTEVSDKTMKDQLGNFTGSPVNYAANLTKSQDIGDLWVFKNGVKGAGLMGFQPNVFLKKFDCHLCSKQIIPASLIPLR